MQAQGLPLQVYEDLLKSGTDPKASDPQGNNALRWHFKNFYKLVTSCEKSILESPAILQIMIEAGANPHHRNDAWQLRMRLGNTMTMI